MNTAKTLIALAFSFAAAGSALAQEAGSDAWMQADGSKTRGQVQHELAKARHDGSLRAMALGYLPTVGSSVSRDAVVAELIEARATGEFGRLNAEAWQRIAPVAAFADVRVSMVR